MKTIGELIERDLSRTIEEIIKVEQTDQQSVHDEINEYVATDRLRREYRELLRAIAGARTEPHEGVGVWISGFFGSGKSSFAKILGYALANRDVLGRPAAELIKKQIADAECSNFIDLLNKTQPTELVMFDVQTDRAIGGAGYPSVSQYMYRALLRTLGYAEDLDLAELEQTLEADGQLARFVETVERRARVEFESDQEKFKKQLAKDEWRWSHRRKLAFAMNEASAALHEMLPSTYTTADSWAHAQARKRVDVTPALLVERSFELAARRRPDCTLLFIVDEVGAYVARSFERIEDLRAVVEEFGRVGKNRVRAREAIAPVWVVVTAQEKLSEVVAAIDSKRIDLPKLQDRFKYHVDLSPADIREVATRRVLAKKPSAVATLTRLFGAHEGELAQMLALERASGRSTDMNAETFTNFYPYPPHFIDLSIDIMSGIRIQPGSARHLGGSNRTIIKQAFEMLVSERTNLKDAPVGRLITLDLLFDLVEGSLSSEARKDVSDIAARFDATPWAARVAKALTLLQMIRDVPRTETNIAAVLYDAVGAPSPRAYVKSAIEALAVAQFVRHTEDGWKLQTPSEKQWNEQRSALDPKPRERAELVRETVLRVLREPALSRFRYRPLKWFNVNVTVDGTRDDATDGIPVHALTVDGAAIMEATLTDVQARSRETTQASTVFWVFALAPEVTRLVTEVLRSKTMIAKHIQLQGQGKITSDEASCLASERQDEVRTQNQLDQEVSRRLQAGVGVFRGVRRDGSALGKTLGEVFRNLCEQVVPDLYPKLDMGLRKLDGDEAEDFLRAANLNGLPQVFYEGDEGFGLVVKHDGRYVPTDQAPIAQAVFGHLKSRTDYGERVDGKDLERKFTGLEYGWHVDVVRIVVAVLLRAGSIEMTYQGKRHRNHQDAAARVPFSNMPAFRAATFAPRETLALKVLRNAAERYEEIAGQEIDIEEGAIAGAFKKLAEQEERALLPVLAAARAERAPTPVIEMLDGYSATLRGAIDGPSDDCVRTLASEGASLKTTREAVRRIRDAFASGGAERLRSARRVIAELAPALAGGPAGLGEAIAALTARLASAEFFSEAGAIDRDIALIAETYGRAYGVIHEARARAAESALDALKAREEWADVPKDATDAIVAAIRRFQCAGLAREPTAPTCSVCHATLPQLESDVDALPTLSQQAVRRLQDASTPPTERVERVRMAEFWHAPLTSEEDVKRFVDELTKRLLKAIAEGTRIILE